MQFPKQWENEFSYYRKVLKNTKFTDLRIYEKTNGN